eukprot:12565810-Prorocentrum_lima.AAC.1
MSEGDPSSQPETLPSIGAGRITSSAECVYGPYNSPREASQLSIVLRPSTIPRETEAPTTSPGP